MGQFPGGRHYVYTTGGLPPVSFFTKPSFPYPEYLVPLGAGAAYPTTPRPRLGVSTVSQLLWKIIINAEASAPKTRMFLVLSYMHGTAIPSTEVEKR